MEYKATSVHCGQYKRYGDFFRVWEIETENEDEEGNVDLHVSSYIPGENNEGGELLPVETDAEWDMIEEVINTFLAEEDEDAE